MCAEWSGGHTQILPGGQYSNINVGSTKLGEGTVPWRTQFGD